ncbi:MAG: hypothetical protein U0793_13075 [Gemmataceae bacterium]
MRRSPLFLACFFLAAPLLTQEVKEEIVKDRKDYIPARRHVAVPGKAIGMMVFDAQPVLTTEGRSGPADEMCYSVDGNSYRWVYVPSVDERPMITNLTVPVGDGTEKAMYPALDMASPKALARFGVKSHYVLVELVVNGGKGSPAGDSFVGDGFRVLDGSKAYPLKTADVIEQLKKTYAAWKKDNAKTLDDALAGAQTAAIKDKKPTGPRETQDLMYVTWLSKENLLEVRFRTKISDGDYRFVEGGGVRPPVDPLPPKLPPRPEASVPEASAPLSFVAFPPPPPPRFKIRVGTGFGIEYGRAYRVNVESAVVAIRTLPPEPFITPELPVPGVLPPRGRPGPGPFLR